MLSLEYRPDTEKLLVTVLSARDIPDKARSGMDSWQVHMVLLPSKKQRHKTSIQRGSLPHFNETYRFSRVDPSDLHMLAIRFRLYALGGRMSRERMMGEKVLRLGGLDPDGGTMETTLVLEPRSNLKVSKNTTFSRGVCAPGSGLSLCVCSRRLTLFVSFRAWTLSSACPPCPRATAPHPLSL